MLGCDQRFCGQELNREAGISAESTRDDIVTCFLAGLDTVRTAILAVLWHMLHPSNAAWRHDVVAELAVESVRPSESMRDEGLRLSTPGSVFNSAVVKDFELRVGDRTYELRHNTL